MSNEISILSKNGVTPYLGIYSEQPSKDLKEILTEKLNKLKGKPTPKVEAEPFKESALYLGDMGSGAAAVAMQQTVSNIKEEPDVVDWVLDLRCADNTPVCFDSLIKVLGLKKNVHVFNHMVKGDQPITKSSHVSSILYHDQELFVDTCFDCHCQKRYLKKILGADNPVRLDELAGKILEDTTISAEEKTSIFSTLCRLNEMGFYESMSNRTELAWSKEDIFSNNALNIVLLPSLELDPSIVPTYVDNYLSMIVAWKQKYGKRVRLTIMGGDLIDKKRFVRFADEFRDDSVIMCSRYDRVNGVGEFEKLFSPDSIIFMKCKFLEYGNKLVPSHSLLESLKALEGYVRNQETGMYVKTKYKYINHIEDFFERAEVRHANGVQISQVEVEKAVVSITDEYDK